MSEDPKDDRQFMCYWGSDFVEPGTLQLCRISDFTEETGYMPTDILAIQYLEIGETYRNGVYATHFITRVEDLKEE